VKCKHENADHLMPGDRWASYRCRPDAHVDGCGQVAQCEQFRCLDCGAWLPLGPSNDEPEQVRVEMRAASMISCHKTDSRCCCFLPSKRLAPMGLERDARELADECIATMEEALAGATVCM
jgi:hypothetical protein